MPVTHRASQSRLAAPTVNPKIVRFLDEVKPPTPCLVVDLDVVVEQYRRLVDALPEASVYYAVKANPDRPIIELLRDLGSSFDVASPKEIDLCLEAGVNPAAISYGNTIKKRADIEYAFERGVRMYAFDSIAELEKLSDLAPGSEVFCRILTSNEGAEWPLSRKFGCEIEMAADLLKLAPQLGLDPTGVAFHVGSQQKHPRQWDEALALTARLFHELEADGINLRSVNLGGGFPARYRTDIPPVESYAQAIRRAMKYHFGGALPQMIAEPGRYMVGDAGVLRSEVVLVSWKREGDDKRWVFLDIGVFGGLAETIDEAIKYEIVTSRDGGPVGPVVIAGPTCDSVDIMYEHSDYRLPLDLQAGDTVDILSTGAYTTTYASIGFNGFAPLQAFCI